MKFTFLGFADSSFLLPKDKLSRSVLLPKILGMLYWSIQGNLFFMVCISAFKPESSEQLSSVLESPRDISWIGRLPFVLLKAYLMIIYIEISYVYIFFFLAFFIPSLELCRKMRWEEPPYCPLDYFSVDLMGIIYCRQKLEQQVYDVAKVKRSFRNYRCLQILLQKCNAVYNYLVGCGTVLLILYAILCTYGAVRFHGLIAATFVCIGTSCTAFLAILLGTTAEFNSKSKLLLVAFRRSVVGRSTTATRGELAMLRRQLGAMTDLKFQVGGLYFVDKAIVMTTFKIIFDFTVNLLILHWNVPKLRWNPIFR